MKDEVTGSPADSSLTNTPAVFGLPLKYVSLVTLALQNAMLSVIMHYSRVSSSPAETYSAATAVLMVELLKGGISFVIAFARIEPPKSYTPNTIGLPPSPTLTHQALVSRFRRLWKEIFRSDCWKLSIPAILYVIQNNLQYVAASNLEAATFQVTYQMKILTTAAFSVLLLRKSLSPAKWTALLFLAIGVGVVQIDSGGQKSVFSSDYTMNPCKGFLAVFAACFTSGLAGVYFEMVLKNSQSDLWVRNLQLSLFSLVPALIPIVLDSTRGGKPLDLFHNFGGWAWATVAIQVMGGLITALVIKYADNILKGFATSLSIIISCLASVALFNFPLTITFVLGSGIVLVATWIYNQPDTSGGISWRERQSLPFSLPSTTFSNSLPRVPSSSSLFSTTSSPGPSYLDYPREKTGPLNPEFIVVVPRES